MTKEENLGQVQDTLLLDKFTGDRKFKIVKIVNGTHDQENHLGQGKVHDSEPLPLTYKEKATLGILCYINLINYMDRFTLAGVLGDVKSHYDLTNEKSGFLQTTYNLLYLISALGFGYWGDRYSKRWTIAFGLGVWSFATILGSFTGSSFNALLVTRAVVGIGQASFSTIAPTVISDIVTKDKRSKVLMLFYFVLPIGSGLGYIVGAGAASIFDDWRYSLRATPILGLIGILLIIFVMVDPVRGQSESGDGLVAYRSSYYKDIMYLLTNKSYMLSTGGYTCVSFVSGALTWWGPIFLTAGFTIQEDAHEVNMANTSFNFGIAMMLSGLVGVPLGSIASQKLRLKSLRGDPLICAVGLFASGPLLYIASLSLHDKLTTFILIFFGMLFLNLTWCIVADILLYTVMPTRRSAAQGLQIFISFAFGAAGSPYLIGFVSDEIRESLEPSVPLPFSASANSTKDWLDFESLSYSLYIAYGAEILGGIFFLCTALYIVQDKRKCDRSIRGNSTSCVPVGKEMRVIS